MGAANPADSYTRDVARVREAEAQLKNAQMPVGRSQEREAAEAEIATAKAFDNAVTTVKLTLGNGELTSRPK